MGISVRRNKSSVSKLTRTQEREYIRNSGYGCPFCEANQDSIQYHDHSVDSGIYTESLSCQECSGEWVNIYKLTRIETHNYNSKRD